MRGSLHHRLRRLEESQSAAGETVDYIALYRRLFPALRRIATEAGSAGSLRWLDEQEQLIEGFLARGWRSYAESAAHSALWAVKRQLDADRARRASEGAST